MRDIVSTFRKMSTKADQAHSFAYDANGNRTGVTTATGTIAATYDDQDRILTFGDRIYTHTSHGEVRSWTDSSGTTTLSYDVQGNLLAVSLPSGTTVEYVVDARNRRIGRKVNGAVTHGWLYQGQLRPIAELNASGAMVSRFVYGARAVAPEYMLRGDFTYRLITDHLGSVRLVVNTSTGAIVQRLDYDAWGQVIADTNPGFQPFGYAGGLFDPSTFLVRFGLRDYSPEIGRWLSKDPIGFEGLDANLYSYVKQDPVNWVDPVGMDWISASGNFTTGVADALSFGLGPLARGAFDDALGTDISVAVDQCSTAYSAGTYAALGAGVVRVGYAAAIRLATVGVPATMEGAAAAVATRNLIRNYFWLGQAPVAGKTIAQAIAKYGPNPVAIIAAAGRSNKAYTATGIASLVGGSVGVAQSCQCP